MFEALRGFLDGLTAQGAGRRKFDENDHRLAATALLIHVADADGEFDAQENRRLREIVEARFGWIRAKLHDWSAKPCKADTRP